MLRRAFAFVAFLLGATLVHASLRRTAQPERARCALLLARALLDQYGLKLPEPEGEIVSVGRDCVRESS